MAPEVFDKHQYDGKVDIWSMGCVTYEMLVGSPPFGGSSYQELFSNIRNSRALRLPDDVDVSPRMEELLKSTLERNPVNRASVQEFVQLSNDLPLCVESEISSPIQISTMPSKTTTNLYSPAPTTVNSETDENNRRRVQSADSSGRRLHNDSSSSSSSGSGWSHSQSHSPPITAYSPAKSVTASGNTSSVLEAAFGFVWGQNAGTSPYKSPGLEGPARRRVSLDGGVSGSSSPYGPAVSTKQPGAQAQSSQVTIPRPSAGGATLTLTLTLK